MSNSNGHGGARKNAGRKSKEDEIKIVESMDAARAPDKIWEDLAKLCKKGNERAIRTWCHYRFGKPLERIDLNNNQDMLTGFKIVRATND